MKITKSIILRGEKEVQKIGWKILATTRNKKGKNKIEEILKVFNIENILYRPNLLIEKKNYKYFVIFSEKTKFPFSKSKQEYISGIDWFKYKLSQYIEAKTNIPIGIIMYSKEEEKIIFRQMNQLPIPHYWFRDEGCLLSFIRSYFKIKRSKEKQLKKKKRLQFLYKMHKITQEELEEIKIIKKDNFIPILKCMKCLEQYPFTCQRCIKYKKKKVFAIWNVKDFETKNLTSQLSLFYDKI